MSARLRGQAGQVTFFGLGLVMALLFVGGVGFDLWHVLAERRALAEVADAAAAAGSNGLDSETVWAGEAQLDPALAEAFAWDSLHRQPDQASLTDAAVSATPDEIEVVVRGEVAFALLGVLPGAEPVTVEVRATSRPARGGS